jgi:hypothetical protein
MENNKMAMMAITGDDIELGNSAKLGDVTTRRSSIMRSASPTGRGSASPTGSTGRGRSSTTASSFLEDVSKDYVNVADTQKMEFAENVRDRMTAAGQFAVIAALMAGIAFSSFSVELKDDPELKTWIDGFIISSSLTVGFSLILLFQQVIEYIFCMRTLASYGTEISLTLVLKLRVHRRIGEISFALSVPSFFTQAACLAYIKASMLNYADTGWISAVILLAFGVLIVFMMITSQILKKKVERAAKWAEREQTE